MTDLESNTPAALQTPAIDNLIENAAACFEVDRTAARDYLFRAFALIRAQKLTRVQEPQRGPGGLIAWQTARVLAYIEAHVDKPIHTKELAGEVKLSVSHFFRSFKATTGMTPCEYITRRRVAVAQQLMRTTREPFCQIAIDCGLSDQSHLCRLFRRVVGQTPTAWRKVHALEPASMESDKGRRFSRALA